MYRDGTPKHSRNEPKGSVLVFGFKAVFINHDKSKFGKFSMLGLNQLHFSIWVSSFNKQFRVIKFNKTFERVCESVLCLGLAAFRPNEPKTCPLLLKSFKLDQTQKLVKIQIFKRM